MKIRIGFVSNSSSSSFVCDVCGAGDSGWDATIRDFGFLQCVNGHTFCEGEAVESIENAPERNEEGEEYDEEFEYHVPEKYCPICSFIEIQKSDLVNYLIKTTGVTKEEVFKLVKEKNKRRQKLYDSEYITEACSKSGVTQDGVVSLIKEKFQDYKSFVEFMRSK